MPRKPKICKKKSNYKKGIFFKHDVKQRSVISVFV